MNLTSDLPIDAIISAVAKDPKKVLDAIATMCETQEALIDQLVLSPLRTEDDVRNASRLQGRIAGLQDVVQTLIEKLLSDPEEDLIDGP
jgi:hypothetical protein